MRSPRKRRVARTRYSSTRSRGRTPPSLPLPTMSRISRLMRLSVLRSWICHHRYGQSPAPDRRPTPEPAADRRGRGGPRPAETVTALPTGVVQLSSQDRPEGAVTESVLLHRQRRPSRRVTGVTSIDAPLDARSDPRPLPASAPVQITIRSRGRFGGLPGHIDGLPGANVTR